MQTIYTDRNEQDQFEKRVIQMCRSMWPQAGLGAGSVIVNGRERDGVFVTEDIVHLVECTVSRRKDNAETNCGKLRELARTMERSYPDKAIKKWFITKDEPTADQRTVCKKNGVTAVKFSDFADRRFGGHSYIQARENYAFGSISDVVGHGRVVPRDEYVPLTISTLDCSASYDWKHVAALLRQGNIVVLLGDFGAGKSLTTREVFYDLCEDYRQSVVDFIPVALNLRDHWGQENPDEAIYRHAEKIGLEYPHRLVSAWHAGRLCLMLDGFDELASRSWSPSTKAVAQARHSAMELVRRFIRGAAGRSGLLVTGRRHYFDSIAQMISCLGLRDYGYQVFVLQEFSVVQVRLYAQKKKIAHDLPEWLPKRPLLLGYLLSRGLLEHAMAADANEGPAQAWDNMIDLICARESEIEVGIEPAVVRGILEYLSTRARVFATGNGPVYMRDIVEAFRHANGYDPDDKNMVLLQRLPGLSSEDQIDGSRWFIDREMQAVLSGRSTLQLLENPHVMPPEYAHCVDPLAEIGVCLIGSRARETKEGAWRTAITAAIQKHRNEIAASDVLCSYIAASQGATVDFGGMTLTGGAFDVLNLEDTGVYNLVFDSCVFHMVRLGPSAEELPTFRSCTIELLESIMPNPSKLACFDNACEINLRGQSVTSNALLDTRIPLPSRVLLVVLRKLYMQKGSGRRENSLFRGLDVHARQYVGPIIDILRSENMIWSVGTTDQKIWHVSPRTRIRAMQLLTAGSRSTDPIMLRVCQLESR